MFFACPIQKPPGSDSNLLHKYKFEGTNTKRNFSPDTKSPPPVVFAQRPTQLANYCVSRVTKGTRHLPSLCSRRLLQRQRCLRCVSQLQTYRVSSRLFKTAEYGSIDSLCGRRMNASSDSITAVLPVFVGTFSIEADRKTINALRKIYVSSGLVQFTTTTICV